jgi:hypothetical protein
MKETRKIEVPDKDIARLISSGHQYGETRMPGDINAIFEILEHGKWFPGISQPVAMSVLEVVARLHVAQSL